MWIAYRYVVPEGDLLKGGWSALDVTSRKESALWIMERLAYPYRKALVHLSEYQIDRTDMDMTPEGRVGLPDLA